MVSDRTLAATFGLPAAAVARWGDLIRAVSTMAVALVLAALSLVYAQTVKNTIAIRQLQDFGIFYESALAARSAFDPYRVATPPSTDTTRHPNLNPPHFHLLVMPFTLVDARRAFAAWLLVSSAALIASLALVCQSLHLRGWTVARLCALVFASPAMVATLMSGQVGVLLLLPFTLAWRYARRNQDAAAGVWMGACASIKPFLLLFFVYFAFVRRARAARMVALTVAAAFAVGLSVFGVQAHRTWISQLLSVTWAEHYMNASILGLVERTLARSEWQQQPIANVPWLVTPIWIVAAGSLGILALLRVRTIADVDRQLLLITLTALLVSPLGWVYYLWFLVPPLTARLTTHSATSGWQRSLMTVGLVGLFVPPIVPWTVLRWENGLATVTVGSVYAWALIALWTATWREP